MAGLDLQREESESCRDSCRLPPCIQSDPVVDDGQLVVVCDTDGRVRWRHGRPAVRRLADRLGSVGGSAWTEHDWLLRVGGPDPADPTDVVLHLCGSTGGRPLLRVGTLSGSWEHRPMPRHAEILEILARHDAGCTAAQLADDLFADATRVVTVRAEVSRPRRALGSLLETQPHRFAAGVTARVEES